MGSLRCRSRRIGRRVVRRPKVGCAGIDVGLGFVALLLSPLPARHRCPPRRTCRGAAAFDWPGVPFPPSTRKGPLGHPSMATVAAHVLPCSRTLGAFAMLWFTGRSRLSLQALGARKFTLPLLAGPPSNGVDFATSPSHAALELEQQDRMLELGEGQGTSLEQEVRGPAAAPAHDLKQAQSVFVQHPKVGRAVVDVVVGLVALPPSPRRRRVVRRPKVGRAGIDVGLGFVALLLSPLPARHRCPPRRTCRGAAAFDWPGVPFPPSTRKGPLRHPSMATVAAHVLPCSRTLGAFAMLWFTARSRLSLQALGARKFTLPLLAGPPSNGIDFATSPSHAALELEQQDRWSSGKGKALRSNSRSEVQLQRRPMI
jgi:hypothetical protein